MSEEHKINTTKWYHISEKSKRTWDVLIGITTIIVAIIIYNASISYNKQNTELITLQQKEIIIKTLDNDNPQQKCLGIELANTTTDKNFKETIFRIYYTDTNTSVVNLAKRYLDDLEKTKEVNNIQPQENPLLNLQQQVAVLSIIDNDNTLLTQINDATLKNDISAKRSLLNNAKLSKYLYKNQTSPIAFTTESEAVGREFDNKFSIYYSK